MSTDHDDPQPGGFGPAVRARRRDLRLRQRDLADLAGVSERFVFALENGKESIQLDKVLAVLATLGLHLELQRGAAAHIAVTGVATQPGASR